MGKLSVVESEDHDPETPELPVETETSGVACWFKRAAATVTAEDEATDFKIAALARVLALETTVETAVFFTVAVLAVSVIVAYYLGLLDFLFGQGLKLLLTR